MRKSQDVSLLEKDQKRKRGINVERPMSIIHLEGITFLRSYPGVSHW